MDCAALPASNFSLTDLVKLLNRGFEEYFIPIRFTADLFSTMLRKDGIDLAESRILMVDDQACGIALIAPRPAVHTSRLAAMGITREMRGRRAGTWFMEQLVRDACERGEHAMVLEVIEQNEPAVKLYRNYGFQNVRRLVGYVHRSQSAEKTEGNNLHEIDLQVMSGLIAQDGLADLPWQLSAESITRMKPPPHAFRSGRAYIVLSNPEAEHVVIWSLLVEQGARGNGLGTTLLKQVTANWRGRTWHIPALCPEEFGRVFERAGFQKETLSQWQMKLKL